MLSWLPLGTDLVREVSPATWAVENLEPWNNLGTRLHSWIPSGYDAYLRIFHPAGLRPANTRVDLGTGTRWADLGRHRNVSLSPEVAFIEVAGIAPGDERALDEIGPSDGRLPPPLCRHLAMCLTDHTTTPETAWFCLWEGNGAWWSHAHGPWDDPDAEPSELERSRSEHEAQDALLSATPRVDGPLDRNYFLFRGPVSSACSFEVDGWYIGPNLWWPDDRAWIVITEIEGYSSYVGGSREAIHALLVDPEIEAIEVPLDVPMDPGPYRPRLR
jgi:hypothetical protein